MSNSDKPRPFEARASLAWLAPPDPALLEFSSGGARHLTLVRLWIFAVLAAVSFTYLGLLDDPVVSTTTAVACTGLLVSAFVAWRVRVGSAIPGLSFIGATLDVSLVTTILVGFAVSGRPWLAVNSMFIFDLYLVAVMVTVLQFDLRVVVYSGVMALLQWAGLLAWVDAAYGPLGQMPTEPIDTGVVQTLRFGLLALFAVAAGLVVVKTSRLVHLSGSDVLTGLANRALLNQRLVEEVAVARRWARRLSIAFLDIDHFKDWNDRWGHAAGDAALRATADALIEECRESDVIARWGGEEFVIVLPDSGAKDATMVVERIRQRLAGTRVPGAAADARVVLSAGIAEFPADGEDAAALEQVADRRLLVAKRQGRNLVVSRS